MKYLKVYTPENINFLFPNQIFVFGSNLAGKHDAGGAKTALEKFGAIYGQGEGLQGNSYAIPTLDENMQKLSIESLRKNVINFLQHAGSEGNKNKLYLVTKIGCGIAGYKPSDIAPLFHEGEITYQRNIILPKEFYI